jgi:acyl-CoA thioesterase I
LICVAAQLGFAEVIRSMPLLSAGKFCFVSTDAGHSANLTDNSDTTGWTGSTDSWVALNVGGGYSRVLFDWVPMEYNEWIPYYDQTGNTGSPSAYQILVSANSTNGSDGTWNVVADIQGSHYNGRMHSFAFAGKSWVKLIAKSSIGLAEIRVYDASIGTDDTWAFMGNSITSTAFGNSIAPTFAQDIAAAHPGFYPAKICAGWSGAHTPEGIAQIDDRLAVNPDIKHWCLEYGTNDNSGGMDTGTFRANLEIIIGKIIAAGRVPILSRCPYNYIGGENIYKYNAVIDNITVKHGFLPGPDLYTWFQNHREESKDGTHPNAVGSASMNRLWAQAVSSLYGTSTAVVPQTGIAQVSPVAKILVKAQGVDRVQIEVARFGKKVRYGLLGNMLVGKGR